MSNKDKRLDNIADALGVTDDEFDAGEYLIRQLREGRTRGPATETREQIEAFLQKLEAVERKSELHRLAISLQRAKLRAGCYVGSEAEEHRARLAAEELLGDLGVRPERDVPDHEVPILASCILEAHYRGESVPGGAEAAAIVEAARARRRQEAEQLLGPLPDEPAETPSAAEQLPSAPMPDPVPQREDTLTAEERAAAEAVRWQGIANDKQAVWRKRYP